MRNFILILVLFVLVSKEISAQIPNGGFEEWEAIQNFEKPLLWSTNQDSNFVRFEKDTISTEGKFSMKVVPSAFSAFDNCNSSARTGLKLQQPLGENKSLTFFAKSIPDTRSPFTSVFLSVSGQLFQSGIFKSAYSWVTYVKIEDFTKIKIPLDNSLIDSLTIQIIGGATNGAADGCHRSSVSWIDDMAIEDTDITSSNPELAQRANVIIYPNPTNGMIEIYHKNITFNEYQLFTLNGLLIGQGELIENRIVLNNKVKGVFLLKLMMKSGNKLFEVAKQITIK